VSQTLACDWAPQRTRREVLPIGKCMRYAPKSRMRAIVWHFWLAMSNSGACRNYTVRETRTAAATPTRPGSVAVDGSSRPHHDSPGKSHSHCVAHYLKPSRAEARAVSFPAGVAVPPRNRRTVDPYHAGPACIAHERSTGTHLPGLPAANSGPTPTDA